MTHWITPGGSIITGSGGGRYVLNDVTIPIDGVPHPTTALTIQTLSYLDAGNYTCEAGPTNATDADDRWVSAYVYLQMNSK